ncbi:MAG: OmpA family protein [Pseudomonadota bacterium]
MKTFRLAPALLLAAAVLGGCSSMPKNNLALDEARRDYSAAESDPKVSSLAALELKLASEALSQANDAWAKKEGNDRVDRLAYVAKQKVALSQEVTRKKLAEMEIANTAKERNRILLAQRTREADQAKLAADAALNQKLIAQGATAEARQQALQAQENEREAQRQKLAALDTASDANMQKNNAVAEAQEAQRQKLAAIDTAMDAQMQKDSAVADAQDAQRKADEAQLAAAEAKRQKDDAEMRAANLEKQLNELAAKQTERGLVITLGDVLFDTDKADLKPQGLRSVQKLGDFLKQYPKRTVRVEGFTDSTGDAQHNQDLSERRALSVRNALLAMGIGPDRIANRGYASAYPVASNDTPSNRQLNRRVEIIISEDNGKIAPR